LTLFACCRESYVEGAVKFEEAIERKFIVKEDEQQKTATRGAGAIESIKKPANFTFLFGCNPAEGVAADT